MQFLHSDDFVKKELHISLRHVLETGKNRRKLAELSRTARALTPVKIQFFQGNYFEQPTPMVIMDFCIGRTVDLLLMGV